MDWTTVKVFKDRARMLAALQNSIYAKTLEERIRTLVVWHRKQLVDEVSGADRGKMTTFIEDDRDEDRS